MKLHEGRSYGIIQAMENAPAPNEEKPKYPNNLSFLMERDGVKPKDLCLLWNVDMGDVSQRVNGKVSITPKRRQKLTERYGWSSSEIFGDPNASVMGAEIAKGIIAAIEGIITTLTMRRIIKKQDLETVYNTTLRDFRGRSQLGAAEVMDHLLDFLHSGPSELAAPSSQQSLQHQPVQSKKEKK